MALRIRASSALLVRDIGLAPKNTALFLLFHYIAAKLNVNVRADSSTNPSPKRYR